jgi:hypothetical protein
LHGGRRRVVLSPGGGEANEKNIAKNACVTNKALTQGHPAMGNNILD